MEKLIEELLDSPLTTTQVSCYKIAEEQQACFAPFPESLHKDLVDSLKNNLGIKKLYSHQREAYDLVTSGANVIITTPTSSGKSLCFNLPIMDSILKDPKNRALYIYPTKALAEDQLQKLNEFGFLANKIFTYDGDTPKEERAYIRKHAGAVLTNPDMLHSAMLPYNAGWADFFYNLKYVVIDEFHSYKGAFASHMAFIIRRLRRICAYYGSNPTFILASATISNATVFAKSMTGLDVIPIEGSGAAKGERHIIFWNPPTIADSEFRRSTGDEAIKLMLYFLLKKYRTIVFGKSRVSVELMLRSARESLAEQDPSLIEKLVSYRGGYTKESRREIENKIFSNKILGIISTNALELGVDIGGLDVSILAGYPQNASSAWQQFGRAGRSENPSCSILVAHNNPIDQYYMNNPEDFFSNIYEKSVVDTENPYITYDQIACAVSELSATPQEIYRDFGEQALIAISDFLDAKMMDYAGKLYWTGKNRPANEVNIRGTSGKVYNIILIGDRATLLGTCDASQVYYTLYEGAIYLHEGESYIVKRLDTEEAVAYVEETDVDYFTVSNESFNINTTNILASDEKDDFIIKYGFSDVVISTPTFTKKRIKSHEILGRIPLALPDTCLSTQSVHFNIPDEISDTALGRGFNIAGSIHALEHILIAMAPVLINCDRNDLGGVSFTEHPDTGGKPTVFIYDGYLGGIGIARELFKDYKLWFEKALQAMTACKCHDGCPSCIQSPKCGNNNSPLDKAGAVFLLESIFKYLKEQN